ncbi:MAG: sugar isomerase domain-containing protein [Candidatus Hydrogenedentes bacterium]|nr:sugar isomerase domain-containing protein [Candidatus Hydrogenedentota bacterium]
MYLNRYFEAMDAVLAKVRATQREAIERAGAMLAESLAHGGALAVMDTGHMLRYEALCRAGGMIAIAPFAYALNVENTMDQRTVNRSTEESAELERRTVALALDSSKMKRGDVLFINSNSGRTSNVIEAALQCKERGIMTIGIASFEQMECCAVAHPSGKKLIDAADLCVDNGSPHGDALVEVKDNERMCPGSGIASAYVFWAIHAEAVERLQGMGVNPSIYRSVHVGGHEYIEKQRKQFIEKGI